MILWQPHLMNKCQLMGVGEVVSPQTTLSARQRLSDYPASVKYITSHWTKMCNSILRFYSLFLNYKMIESS